jgi:type I restriction enzyme S subunit
MKAAEWKTAKLGDHCEVFSGYPFKSSGFTNNLDDVALVKGENVGQGEILWSISKRWPREDTDDLDRFKLVPGDVVLAMDRPWIPAGLKFARIPESAPDALLVQRVARLRATDGLEQRFLPFVIGSPNFVAYVQNVGRGVGVPHISGGEIEGFTFSLPPKRVQLGIADVLSAYDELIENNRRRMGLLEEAARLLYREWFVRLRFPGHEHARITNGIPEGWEKKRLDAIAEVNRATLPSGYDGEIEYVDIASVVPGQIAETTTLAFQDAPSRARRIVQHGDVIWSCVRPNRRSHAVIWKPAENLIVSTGFAVITPKGAPSTFIYFATTTDAFVGYLDNHARGAAYPAVVAADFERAEILVPPKPLLELFDEFTEPTFSQMFNLRQQNQKLRAARDLLLPRLMSGEIAV